MDFARGTDFKMKTKAKDAKIHPGLHVIGAYLPDSFSDYIQLIGRTGRQGRRGSAMIIIAKDDPQLLKNASKLSINDG
jgi:superfamily II DNA helicase RecQ